MIKRFDHVPFVVLDLEAAKHFFGLLGFQEVLNVLISGEVFSRYMGIDGIEAKHITLVLTDSPQRLEVQLLKYRKPDPLLDPQITKLNKLGYNHVCFVVEDIEAEVERLTANGVKFRN